MAVIQLFPGIQTERHKGNTFSRHCFNISGQDCSVFCTHTPHASAFRWTNNTPLIKLKYVCCTDVKILAGILSLSGVDEVSEQLEVNI